MINHPVSEASQEPLLYFYELYEEKKKERRENRQKREAETLSFFTFWKDVFQQVQEMYKAGCVGLINTHPIHITNYIAKAFQFKE